MSDATITALDPVPLALLPVRLETRYVGPPDAPTELRVRVYPDQVHVDAHQPALTDGEVESAKTYWRHRWGDGPDAAERQAAAWTELTRGVRPPRGRPPRAGDDADERSAGRPAVPGGAAHATPRSTARWRCAPFPSDG